MRTEQQNGAKVSRYNVREDFARFLSTHEENTPPQNPKFAGGYYVVAIGESLPPEPEPVFMNSKGEETPDPAQAQEFDTYGDALRWAAQNCDIPAFDDMFVPRGFEKPRYPRICYLRLYTEITEC